VQNESFFALLGIGFDGEEFLVGLYCWVRNSWSRMAKGYFPVFPSNVKKKIMKGPIATVVIQDDDVVHN
jgi:hypothetical protein